MNFEREVNGDIVIWNINLKRATYRESDEFKELLNKELEEGNKKIIIDLDQSEFMDSTFLGILVYYLKRITKMKGKFVLSSPHSDARAILEITGAVKVFKIYKTKAEALTELSK